MQQAGDCSDSLNPQVTQPPGMLQVIRCRHKIRSFSEVPHARKGQLCGLAVSLSNNMVEVRRCPPPGTSLPFLHTSSGSNHPSPP